MYTSVFNECVFYLTGMCHAPWGKDIKTHHQWISEEANKLIQFLNISVWNLTFTRYSPSSSITVHLLVSAVCQSYCPLLILQHVYTNGCLKWEKLIYFVIIIFFISTLNGLVSWCQRWTLSLSYSWWWIQKVVLSCLASAGWPNVMLLWTFVKETFVCMP